MFYIPLVAGGLLRRLAAPETAVRSAPKLDAWAEHAVRQTLVVFRGRVEVLGHVAMPLTKTPISGPISIAVEYMLNTTRKPSTFERAINRARRS